MQKFITIILFCIVPTLNAQVYSTNNVAVVIPDNTNNYDIPNTCQLILVQDVGVVINDLRVDVTISHEQIGDLSIKLISPDFKELTLLSRPGRSGTNGGRGDDANLDGNTKIIISDSAVSGISAEQMGATCANTNDQIGVHPDCAEDNYKSAPDFAVDIDTPNSVGNDFSDFAGDISQGAWLLCVADSGDTQTGSLLNWKLGVNTSLPVELQSFSID